MRLVRVMNVFPKLRIILKGVFIGLKYVKDIMLLLFLVMYMYAMELAMFNPEPP